MNRLIRSVRPQFLVVAALVLSATSVRAQEATVSAAPAAAVVVDSVAPAPAAGPTMNAAAVGVRRGTDFHNASPAPVRSGGYGQSVALMVVGGAAVLTGLIVGGGAGYAISVGGAVVGLIGLYQYIQ